MRTSSVVALAAWRCSVRARAFALDAAPRPPPLAPNIKSGSAREALRDGCEDYNAGDKRARPRRSNTPAGQGHTLALWKLGRMYADGDGVSTTT